MTGRRSDPRVAVTTPWDGAVKVLRPVVVQRAGPDELLAISQSPGVVGEEMSLDVLGGGDSLGLRVRVTGSAPMMFNGAVRHRLRLSVISGLTAANDERPGGAVPDASEM